jgi:hypothetical protein
VRVVPDLVRVVYPLSFFGYTTNGDNVVITVPAALPPPRPGATKQPGGGGAPPAATFGRGRAARARGAMSSQPVDLLLPGDVVRIDRIAPLDRKPGLTGGRTYTYDNPDRWLPIERQGKERIVHLAARSETDRGRNIDMLRILLCVAGVGLGAMLFLVKPSIATAAFFVFSLAAVEAPTTYLDGVIPMPWRQIPEWVFDTLREFVRPALLLFALCLIDGDTDAPRERLFAWFAAALGIALGPLNAYAQWAQTYQGQPVEHLDRILRGVPYGLSVLTVIALAVAFARASANDRHRISWIAAAFVFAGLARAVSDAFYPSRIPFWSNQLLVSATIVPIVTIWIAVVRHRFFNVDFVVSRAVVYAALTAAVIGTLSIIEELGTYQFYMNTDVAYFVIIALSIVIGILSGRITEFMSLIVDRFIFRDRHQQRKALEYIAGYILDAETVDDVHRALLQDAAHALNLSFSGILERQPDGGYRLDERYNWPNEFEIALGPADELTLAIASKRGALTFSGKDTRLIQHAFPNERVTFAAPLFYGRSVSGIVVYGHNISGLDLDPEERQLLVRVVAHASIALNAIELARYRNAAVAAVLRPSATTQPSG